MILTISSSRGVLICLTSSRCHRDTKKYQSSLPYTVPSNNRMSIHVDASQNLGHLNKFQKFIFSINFSAAACAPYYLRKLPVPASHLPLIIKQQIGKIW